MVCLRRPNESQSQAADRFDGLSRLDRRPFCWAELRRKGGYRWEVRKKNSVIEIFFTAGSVIFVCFTCSTYRMSIPF